MPAHLESTERAMDAEKARAGQTRRSRTTSQGEVEVPLEEEEYDDESQEPKWNTGDKGGIKATKPNASAKHRWQTQRRRIRTALSLQQQQKRKPLKNKQPTIKPRGADVRKQDTAQESAPSGSVLVGSVGQEETIGYRLKPCR